MSAASAGNDPEHDLFPRPCSFRLGVRRPAVTAPPRRVSVLTRAATPSTAAGCLIAVVPIVLIGDLP